MAKYLGYWSNKEDVARDFHIDSKELTGCTVHVAWYGYGDYCGSAFVLFEKDGQLYENHGSHCSCMGLEDQWSPEETTVDAIDHFLTNGYWFDGFDDGGEAKAALERFVKRRRKASRV